MNANELRIGNFIEVENNIIDVGIIKEKFISWNVAKYPENRVWNPFIPVNDKRLKGISLTEEWLLNFGFEKINEGHFALGRFELVYKSAYNYWYVMSDGSSGNNYFTKLEFIHELQNLVFAMDGTELKLNRNRESI